MPIGNTASAPLSTVEINGQAVDVVRKFTYLGSIISSSGTLDAKISARSAKACSVFGRLLRAVFHKPQISRHTKDQINTASAPLSTVEINGQAVDVVRKFTYLGSIISSSGTLDAEISARSAKACSVFGQLPRAVFHKLQISRHTKDQIYNAAVSSIMMYSSAQWPITQTLLRRVDAVQARHLRQVEDFK